MQEEEDLDTLKDLDIFFNLCIGVFLVVLLNFFNFNSIFP